MLIIGGEKAAPRSHLMIKEETVTLLFVKFVLVGNAGIDELEATIELSKE